MQHRNEQPTLFELTACEELATCDWSLATSLLGSSLVTSHSPLSFWARHLPLTTCHCSCVIKTAATSATDPISTKHPRKRLRLRLPSAPTLLV